jgi:hypothetical protein
LTHRVHVGGDLISSRLKFVKAFWIVFVVFGKTGQKALSVCSHVEAATETTSTLDEMITNKSSPSLFNSLRRHNLPSFLQFLQSIRTCCGDT